MKTNQVEPEETEEKTKTRWSRPGKPKGYLRVRRFPNPKEMKALAKVWKKQRTNLTSPTLISAMYRLIEGYQGSEEEIAAVKALVPDLPEGMEWKLSDKSKTLADPKHMIGVEFGTEENLDGFFPYLAKQEHPECVNQFLTYAEAYKAEKKAKKAQAGSVKTTPTKVTKAKKAKKVSPPEVASLPVDSEDDGDMDESFGRAFGAYYATKKRKLDFKTDKSEE